jgi:hypothetical protein
LGPLGKLPLLDVPDVPDVLDEPVEAFIVTWPTPLTGEIEILEPAII